MQDNRITQILSLTADKVSEMAKSDCVAGEPIISGDITVIPFSKISCGFCGGSSTLSPKKSDGGLISGAGAGRSSTPVSFLVIKNGEVTVLNAGKQSGSVSQLFSAIPKLAEKFKKSKN